MVDNCKNWLDKSFTGGVKTIKTAAAWQMIFIILWLGGVQQLQEKNAFATKVIALL